MSGVRILAADRKAIENCLNEYDQKMRYLNLCKDQIIAAITHNHELPELMHSMKSRIKEREHLRDKLERRAYKCRAAKKPFDIKPGDLLTKINDLVGVRILHLYTRQMPAIDKALRELFQDQHYNLIEKPFARTWDDEYRQFFSDLGFDTQSSPSMYTSVHYVVATASETQVTCEIQVRTLMEEVWGEVDHQINYPHRTNSLPCSEQLKVLARVTSSATRLVDSIFLSLEDSEKEQKS